jgi:hypothetical protein
LEGIKKLEAKIKNSIQKVLEWDFEESSCLMVVSRKPREQKG